MTTLFRTSAKKQEFKWLPVGSIARNPNQPRKIFDEAALRELADSIARFGVITPLTVRRVAGGYELIAGERRLRASQMAGLTAVPCYVMVAEEEDSSLMALVENLQRRDLDFFEEALGLLRLTELYGMTQQQAAEQIGRTQSAVANKLRLLRLGPETIATVRECKLTERHARALLRITEEDKQLAAAQEIARRSMNVEQAEAYIERLLTERASPTARTRRFVTRDVRLFLNTITRAVTTMQQSGFGARIERRNEDDMMVLTIRIPQHPL